MIQKHQPHPRPLAGFRALDLTDEKGFLCGKILGDLGADVIKIERPGGDAARQIGPYYKDQPHPERSLLWLAHNANKRSITIDLESTGGAHTFRRLISGSHFLIESFPPGHLDRLGLGYAALSRPNPGLVVTSITPFGQTGPYRDYAASDLVCMAMGGLMWLCGDPDRPPVRISIPQAYAHAGAEAAVGTMIAHHYRQSTGIGQRVDVSIQESVAWTLMNAWLFWETSRVNLKRAGAFRVGLSSGGVQRVPWPCKDGYVAFALYGGTLGVHTNSSLVQWMDSEGMAPDFLKAIDWQKFDAFTASQDDFDRFYGSMQGFFLSHTRAELYEGAFKRGIMLYPLGTVATLMEDPQLEARGFWQELEHPDLATRFAYPGAFTRSNEPLCGLDRRAPFAGEHTRQIVKEELEIAHTGTASGSKEDITVRTSEVAAIRRAFEGTKVADFSWAAVGPWTARYLADHGAQVVHIETTTRPDPTRTGPPFKGGKPNPNLATYFAHYNTNKYGATLNLQHPRGLEVARKIVSWADVVVESYTPGTMDRFGLAYSELRKIKPDIIMLSTSNQGQAGPRASHRGLGTHLAALAGFVDATGWPDREPSLPYGAYTDTIAPHFGAAALIAALDLRSRTGRGQHLDLSQYEASAHFMAPEILDFQANNRVATRMGNRNPEAAPHGAYRCQGEEEWFVLAILANEEWTRFREAIGDPDWAKAPRFATVHGRKDNEDELDKLVEEWTCRNSATALVATLQAVGLRAGRVLNCQDMFEDPHLRHRGFFWELKHPEMQTYSSHRPGFILSATPAEPRLPAPCLGEHNEHFYCKILGMSDEEFLQLLRQGVFE